MKESGFDALGRKALHRRSSLRYFGLLTVGVSLLEVGTSEVQVSEGEGGLQVPGPCDANEAQRLLVGGVEGDVGEGHSGEAVLENDFAFVLARGGDGLWVVVGPQLVIEEDLGVLQQAVGQVTHGEVHLAKTKWPSGIPGVERRCLVKSYRCTVTPLRR